LENAETVQASQTIRLAPIQLPELPVINETMLDPSVTLKLFQSFTLIYKEHIQTLINHINNSTVDQVLMHSFLKALKNL
jgi:hypothetical protein